MVIVSLVVVVSGFAVLGRAMVLAGRWSWPAQSRPRSPLSMMLADRGPRPPHPRAWDWTMGAAYLWAMMVWPLTGGLPAWAVIMLIVTGALAMLRAKTPTARILGTAAVFGGPLYLIGSLIVSSLEGRT